MKRICLLFIACFCLILGLQAQSEETVFGKSGLRLSGAWGGSTVNLTAFDGDYAVLSGGFGGLEFNKTIFLGWAGYELVDEVTFTDLRPQSFNLSFNGPILGVHVKANKIVHPQVSLMAGGGRARLQDQLGRDRIFVIQPAVGVNINVFRWFHLAVEGGYRFVNGTDLNGLTDSTLSSAFGQLRFQFGWSWGRARGDINDDW